MRGGEDCEYVSQAPDDLTREWIERPEITVTGVRNFQVLDDEHSLADEAYPLPITGTFDGFARQGVFRRHFFPGDNQTLFVENHTRLTMFVAGATTEGEQYERFYGYECGGVALSAQNGVQTAGDCAQLCETNSDCRCFDYRDDYHLAFQGRCRLAGEGSLVAFPVRNVLQLGATMGLLQAVEAGSPGGVPAPYDAFTGTHVTLSDTHTCLAPSTSMGTNVDSVESCANLCAQLSGCSFFSYNPFTLKCLNVRTTSANCVEGMSPSDAGFHVTSLQGTGALAPTAYLRGQTARVFPRASYPRGDVSGYYVGRARPDFELAIAQCDCLQNLRFGHWDGFRCQTCAKFYGTRTCSKRCPGLIAGENPCFGQGSCLWGSVDGLGETFYEANCLCGDPPAPYADNELAQTGAWDVQTFDLHVTAKFVGLSTTYEPWEDPRNYNFASSSCAACKDRYGGKNCASTCSYCLFGGQCNFLPSTISVRVPCNCISGDFDAYNGCCPRGFFMAESVVSQDVSGLTTTLRNSRLNPGIDPKSVAVAPQTYYDEAVFPDMLNSNIPSRKWCVPCPNIYETAWMQEDPESTACAAQGFCQDRGVRQTWVGAPPPQYYPSDCAELNQDPSDTWQAYNMTLWYRHPFKVFLNETDVQRAVQRYAAGVESTYALAEADSVDAAKIMCAAVGISCTGIVVKEEAGRTVFYLSSSRFIADPQLPAGSTQVFDTYSKHIVTQLCWNGELPLPEDHGVVCALGTTAYLNVSGLDVPLCADVPNHGHSFRNLGTACLVRLDANSAFAEGHGDECFPDLSAYPDAEVKVNPDTDLRQRLAPAADGIVYHADFVVSAVDAPPNLKDMTPENPCGTLDGDYYWGKQNADGTVDRTQCVSATDQDLTCDIREYQLPCTNVRMSGRAAEHLHASMSEALPHKLTVNNLGDVETSVFSATDIFKFAVSDGVVPRKTSATRARVPVLDLPTVTPGSRVRPKRTVFAPVQPLPGPVIVSRRFIRKPTCTLPAPSPRKAS